MAPRPTPARSCPASAAQSGRNASSTRPDGMQSRSRTPAAESTVRPEATLRLFPDRAPGTWNAMNERSSLVMHLAFQKPELQQRDYAQEQQQHHGQCRGIRGIPEPEAELINVIEQKFGRVIGAARGHDHDMVDQPEGIDDGVD